jgi:Family of unknown function (DUF6279)
MKLRLWQRCAVVLLVFVLSACGLVRTGYDNLDTIAYWWMDRYLDFNESQKRDVKAGLKALHAWHRNTQLPAHTDLLEELRQMAKNDVSEAAACDAIMKARHQFETLLLQTAPQVATIALSLEPANLKRLRKKFAEEDKQWREKWLDISAKQLAEDRLDEWTDRSEFFYGRLSATQKQAIRDAISRSALDPKISWTLRQRRQEDILATLEKIQKTKPSPELAEAEIRALMDRVLHPDDAIGAEMRRNLFSEACANSAAMHKLATPAQRKRAEEKLAGLEQDFRKLASR